MSRSHLEAILAAAYAACAAAFGILALRHRHHTDGIVG